MKTEFEIWRDEITDRKPTIAERMARWFDRSAGEPTTAPEDTDPDMFRWWSTDELIAERVALRLVAS